MSVTHLGPRNQPGYNSTSKKSSNSKAPAARSQTQSQVDPKGPDEVYGFDTKSTGGGQLTREGSIKSYTVADAPNKSGAAFGKRKSKQMPPPKPVFESEPVKLPAKVHYEDAEGVDEKLKDLVPLLRK